MIDLSRSRAELLAEIEVPNQSAVPLHGITDAQVVTGNAQVRLRGSTRAEFLPLLKIVLSERFAAVPRPVLIRDLLMPLKHALGNAFRHGNGDDPAKAVDVEVVLTRSGAFIAVTDEGEGFDVAFAVHRLQEQQTYFSHHGSGFRGLHRAVSTVSWENGGRTLLLCFRAPPCDSAVSDDQGGGQRLTRAAEDSEEDLTLRRMLDPAWIRTSLLRELPDFHDGRAKLESCHPYLGRGLAGDDCGIRYVLVIASPDEQGSRVRILTARLHADEATAAADFAAATRLNDGQPWKGVRIPEAVLRVRAEPKLVLYDFDPWMNLWQYLAYRGSLKALRHAASRVGKALALVHRSQAVLRLGESDAVGARVQSVVRSAQSVLGRLPGGADLVDRFRVGVHRIREQAPVDRHRGWAAIHGALSWDRIHYGVDLLFYFYRFENARRSDPAIDLGGFAADLLRFALVSHDVEAYRVSRDDLLAGYNSEATQPMDPDDLPLNIALAIGERLRDVSPRTAADVQHLLAALDVAGTT